MREKKKKGERKRACGLGLSYNFTLAVSRGKKKREGGPHLSISISTFPSRRGYKKKRREEPRSRHLYPYFGTSRKGRGSGREPPFSHERGKTTRIHYSLTPFATS